MTHVSKKKLTPKTRQQIDEFLFALFKQAQNNDSSKDIVVSVLTPTERVMVAKRIFIVFLLTNKETPYLISEKMGVSPSTVARLSEQVEQGKFDSLIPHLPQKQSASKLQNEYINSFFSMMFAILGSAMNTKSLHELQRKYLQ